MRILLRDITVSGNQLSPLPSTSKSNQKSSEKTVATGVNEEFFKPRQDKPSFDTIINKLRDFHSTIRYSAVDSMRYGGNLVWTNPTNKKEEIIANGFTKETAKSFIDEFKTNHGNLFKKPDDTSIKERILGSINAQGYRYGDQIQFLNSLHYDSKNNSIVWGDGSPGKTIARGMPREQAIKLINDTKKDATGIINRSAELERLIGTNISTKYKNQEVKGQVYDYRVDSQNNIFSIKDTTGKSYQVIIANNDRTNFSKAIAVLPTGFVGGGKPV